MQKANIPAEKLKSREQQQQNHTKGVCLGLVPFLFCMPLVWININMLLYGWLFCSLKTAVWLDRSWLYTESGTALINEGIHLPLSSAIAQR